MTIHRYGSIGINTWTGANFSMPGATWGAYPGERLEAVETGIGVVTYTRLASAW